MQILVQKLGSARAALMVALAVSLCGVAAGSAESHTRARLVLPVETVRPGSTVLAGLHLEMDEGWHTYWRNPGASGMPTTVNWKLPAGVRAGEIQWPVPEKLFAEDLTTYVYHGEVVLLIPLSFPADLPVGEITLKAEATWLECKVLCLQGGETVQHILKVGPQEVGSKDAGLIAAWQKRLPQDGSGLQAIARWESAGAGSSRPLLIEWRSADAKDPDFLPYGSESFEVQPATERVSSEPGTVRLRKEVKKLSGEWPNEIGGVLVTGTSQQRAGHEVLLSPDRGDVTLVPGSTQGSPRLALWKILLYAFVGGLILNIMPCVLPVIALKILGFVGQARDHPARVRKLGLIYGLGVLVSFLVLAGLVIAVQTAGRQAGWGMQFGNPLFLVALTVLVTLVAFNLFGLFEITPGARVMDTAGDLASRHGSAGAFFNGVLATILATPCTAPFLSVALGFAMTQTSAALVVLVFATVAAGLAAPYVVLSWHPAWLKFLPRPGLWMERFKVLMGFPMLATAIWLYSLTQTFYGARTWWLALFLVLVGLGAWGYGEFVQRGRSRRGLAGAAVAALLVFSYVGIVEGQLRWRDPVSSAAETGTAHAREGGIEWNPWSPEAVATARAAGRPVLVDFTADWCLTCQANERFALEVPEVRSRLKEINALALKGDYTRFPPAITQELRRFGRAGVPLVLVYPKDPALPPTVLPEALTPGIVLRELSKAAGQES